MWRDSLALVGQRVVSQFLTLYELRKQRVPVNIKPLKNFLSIEILKNTKGTCFHRIIVYNLFHFRFHYSEPIRKFISIYPSKFLKYQRNVFASVLHIYTHTYKRKQMETEDRNSVVPQRTKDGTCKFRFVIG